MTTTTDDTARIGGFLRALAGQIRANDGFGHYADKSDDELVAPYVLTPEQRRAIPLVGDPDPDTLWRIEMFNAALAIAIERETGVLASPIMKMHHEGFGRVLFTAGRLVVLNRYLRDIHRFGYPSAEALGEAGVKLIDEAKTAITTWPDVARA